MGFAAALFCPGLLPVPKQGLPVEGAEHSEPELVAACTEAGSGKAKALNNTKTAKADGIPRFIKLFPRQ